MATGFQIVRVKPSSLSVESESSVVFANEDSAETIRQTLITCKEGRDSTFYWYTKVVSVVVPDAVVNCK